MGLFTFYYMLKHFFLLLISIITLASCGGDDPDGPTPPEPIVPETTANAVFVFMPYTADDNGNYSLYKNLTQNIEDMEKSIIENNGLGDSHLIIFISKDAQNSDLINLYYSKGKCLRDTVKTYNNALYSTAEGISSLLADVKKYAPANAYSMIVGSHGEGWMPANTKTRWFGGNKYQINVTDLAKGINNAGMSMNYILFDDCYMSTVEVAYDLREVTNYLIASTSEMMAYGMPYHKILKYIIGVEPDYASLAKEFINFYKSYNSPYGTIGVTNCKYVEQMAALMRQINASHEELTDADSKVQDLDAGRRTPTVYFDFGSYVNALCADDEGAKAQFSSLMNELVPYKGCTDYIYSAYDGKELKVNEFSGLTISDPSEHSSAINTKQQTAWWKATH